jgi:hypothetical protein
MSENDSKKQVINFAIEELKKAFDDVQQGKTPKPSRSLKRLQKILTEVDSKVKTNIISEDEANKIAQDVISKIMNKGK